MKKSISGIRGVFGDDLTLRHAIEFADNFAHLVGSGRCVVARDTRPSGPLIQEVVTSALLQNGIDVFSLETAPTPVAFREARKYGAGIVVTSSHNPLEWNGLKFVVDGRGVNEGELETIVTRQRTARAPAGERSWIESGYVDDALAHVGGAAGGPRVVVDLGGGAAAGVAPALLERMGCRVDTINESPAGSTRGPDPTADDLADLARLSPRYGVGFAFDLDGDRLVVVKDGVKQPPDLTLGLGIAKSMEAGCRRFVLSVDTSVSIERFVRDNGGRVARSKVGEANVIDAILRTGSDAGGEGSSGGFVLPEFNHCRDGILTSGLVASMLQGGRFGEVSEFMRGYRQLRIKVPATSPAHAGIMGRLEGLMRAEFSETVTIDGIKGIADEDSWVLVRGSNTEDAIRISAESNDPGRAEGLIGMVKGMVERSRGGAG